MALCPQFPGHVFAARVSRVCRYFLYAAIVAICAFAGWQTLVVEAFHIPSGSMAPTLHGRHRVCTCPRCGQEVVVGRSAADRDGSGEPRYYRKAFCPNCGLFPVPVANTPELPGDQVVVNKSIYRVRAPWRWEVVVFRLLGTFYIKRLLGLPGEEILIHDGDVYVNGNLLRKTLAEARTMRVLVFDHDNAPKNGWKERWIHQPGVQATRPKSPSLALRAGETLSYLHFLHDTGKCEPIRDEYAYNAGVRADSECVHDFLIDAELEPAAGRGSLSLRLCDGRDWIEVLLPVGTTRPVELFAWPTGAPERTRKLADSAQLVQLRPGQRQRVELAFVDRRVSLAVDGRDWLSVDLPEAKKRAGVDRPFQAQADGVEVVLRRFRLYRDVHYTQQGAYGVRGNAVRLGPDQYFMLGDNSPSSEDSRFWPDAGRVDRSCLIGPMVSVRTKHD